MNPFTRESIRSSGMNSSLGASLSLNELQYVTDVSLYVTYNALNVISFAASVTVTLLIGWFGYGRDVKGDYKLIHDSLPTLTTPAYWTYALWFLIFFLQLVFVITQMLTPFRRVPIVQEGIQFYFFIIQCCHIAYVVSYCFRSLIVATIFMLVCTGVLFYVSLSIYSINSEYRPMPGSNTEAIMNGQEKGLDTSLDYIIFRLPFHLHFGWAVVTTLVTFGELASNREWGSQSVISFTNLGIFWFVGTFSLFYPEYPNFIIPLAIAWAALGIWVELTPAQPAITDQFPYSTIEKIRAGAIVICIEHGIITVLRFVYHISKNYGIESRGNGSQQLVNKQSTISTF